jgi:hypothetical protein
VITTILAIRKEKLILQNGKHILIVGLIKKIPISIVQPIMRLEAEMSCPKVNEQFCQKANYESHLVAGTLYLEKSGL